MTHFTTFLIVAEILSILLIIILKNKKYKRFALCYFLFLNISYCLIGIELMSTDLSYFVCVQTGFILIMFLSKLIEEIKQPSEIIDSHITYNQYILNFLNINLNYKSDPNLYKEYLVSFDSIINSNCKSILILRNGLIFSSIRDARRNPNFIFFQAVIIMYINILHAMILQNPLLFHHDFYMLITKFILGLTILILITTFIFLIKMYKSNFFACLIFIGFALLIFFVLMIFTSSYLSVGIAFVYSSFFIYSGKCGYYLMSIPINFQQEKGANCNFHQKYIEFWSNYKLFFKLSIKFYDWSHSKFVFPHFDIKTVIDLAFILITCCIFRPFLLIIEFPYILKTSLPSIQDMLSGVPGTGSGSSINPSGQTGPTPPSWPSGPSEPSGPSAIGQVDKDLALSTKTSHDKQSRPRFKNYYFKFGSDISDNYILSNEKNFDLAREKLGLLQQGRFSNCPIYEMEFPVGVKKEDKPFLILDVSGVEGVNRVYASYRVFGIEIPNPMDSNKPYFIKSNTASPSKPFLDGLSSAYDYRYNPEIKNTYLLNNWKP